MCHNFSLQSGTFGAIITPAWLMPGTRLSHYLISAAFDHNVPMEYAAWIVTKVQKNICIFNGDDVICHFVLKVHNRVYVSEDFALPPIHRVSDILTLPPIFIIPLS